MRYGFQELFAGQQRVEFAGVHPETGELEDGLPGVVLVAVVFLAVDDRRAKVIAHVGEIARDRIARDFERFGERAHGHGPAGVAQDVMDAVDALELAQGRPPRGAYDPYASQPSISTCVRHPVVMGEVMK